MLFRSVLWGKKQSESYKFAQKKLKEEAKENDVLLDHMTKMYGIKDEIPEEDEEDEESQKEEKDIKVFCFSK